MDGKFGVWINFRNDGIDFVDCFCFSFCYWYYWLVLVLFIKIFCWFVYRSVFYFWRVYCRINYFLWRWFCYCCCWEDWWFGVYVFFVYCMCNIFVFEYKFIINYSILFFLGFKLILGFLILVVFGDMWYFFVLLFFVENFLDV